MSVTRKPRQSYTVVYRMGGYLNATWHRCVPVATKEEALEQAAEIERGGRKALVRPTAEWDSVGLPVGFCGKCDPITGVCRGEHGFCAGNAPHFSA